MNERSVRSLHYQLGIISACFLMAQVLAGLLISFGTLSSASGAKWFQVLETIHTGWDPVGECLPNHSGPGHGRSGHPGHYHFLS